MEPFAKISARMWSPTVSLKPVARRLGSVAHIYDKGDTLISAKGTPLRLRAEENYLMTTQMTTADLHPVRDEVAGLVQLVNNDLDIARLITEHSLDAVIWVAIFGDEGTADFDDLDIDMSPFGARIGLVLENYTDLSDGGNPRKLLIGPAASRKTPSPRNQQSRTT